MSQEIIENLKNFSSEAIKQNQKNVRALQAAIVIIQHGEEFKELNDTMTALMNSYHHLVHTLEEHIRNDQSYARVISAASKIGICFDNFDKALLESGLVLTEKESYAQDRLLDRTAMSNFILAVKESFSENGNESNAGTH